MRFVPSKSLEQQGMQAVHRVRERRIKARNARTNEIRGLLLEYGIVIGTTGGRGGTQSVAGDTGKWRVTERPQ